MKCEHQWTHGKQPGRQPRPRPPPPRGTPGRREKQRAGTGATRRGGGGTRGRRPCLLSCTVLCTLHAMRASRACATPTSAQTETCRASCRYEGGQGEQKRTMPRTVRVPTSHHTLQNRAPLCPRASTGGEAEGPRVAHQTPKQRRASLRGDRGATATRRRNAGRQPPLHKPGGASRVEQGGRGRRDRSRRNGGGGGGAREAQGRRWQGTRTQGFAPPPPR